MALEEKRGSAAQKLLDQKLGPFLLGALGLLLWVKKRLFTFRPQQEKPLLICFGAIGDLIVLTAAAQQKYPANQLYLACSKLNLPCAKLYSDFYAGIEVVDLKAPWSVLGICRRFGINKIYDSTQWANIGPVQVGIARLFHRGLTAVGFKTSSPIRSMVYDKVIVHGRDVHEAANFVNLLAGQAVVSSNNELPAYFPMLCERKSLNRTGKILFHMWPSGNRSYLKAWPEGYWEELIQRCVALGYNVYLSGAPADQAKTEALVAKLGLSQVASLAGVHNLKDLADFVAREIEFAVSVNTGVLHLVVAAGVPVIGLHGAVNPVRWGPLGGQSISLLPESGRSAYLHYGFEYPEDDSEAYVLDKLSVRQVLGAITELRSRAN
ncbi:glycosyltransferase family 9 protein [Fluviibacter phosphoraccumulans]|uniref:Uncharacterized protein n=1 Tax=Fluviibacter phosphoraccumulans TaxID=1751046 RepID=A0A679ICM4_9RHOO|nr:glycosyltransferase family 9 protein [Fluviibacter phosphoraccumulans]BBU67992.1 hypothetical protein ICHIAU1_02750 [Fluviibacter phosphoraccumulans]BBU70469.1 hypothetical protein ICHIJ1_03880 [Fluviibacter phosphoraccumulans]BCA66182.1 hypothetical protein SHINM1_017840 [Fluviibacter phosphoraccumulans]